MKFGIDIGHNLPSDGGAVGHQAENKLVMDLGLLLIKKLKSAGYEAVGCRPASANSVVDSLRKRVRTANYHGADVFVSLHFNAFNWSANGTEVYAISSRGKQIAQSVVNAIAQLGFINRGVKSGSKLHVVRNTNMPAILVECCFCDSQKDMDLYDKEKMAEAIFQGLIKTCS